ncbi:glycosyltransferase [Pedobacter sp. ASV28]|uniref:glycosyltransferase n=1 Tax=Pedobacter sp. ASV28 TaxID=2795123 RepID=UPI0018EC47D0|nr:glycosyltransferase [Pedobacter sp. ASV28]
MKSLNLFYKEQDNYRWFKYDQYPRKLIRRILRGKQRPGGQMMVAINLMKGLDKLGIPYRFNDYRYARKNPNELIGIIGKDHLIFEKKFKNPILFGASIGINPYSNPNFLKDFPNVMKILVPGNWLKEMFDKKYEKDKINIWPVGIDTNIWNPFLKKKQPNVDFLIYDKIRWDHQTFEIEIINPIIEILNSRSLSYDVIRYGFYEPEQLKTKTSNCKAVIFLCEHETQGIAYQQILATGTPIFAWDRGGYWQDPAYYPDKIKFQPVSSVPYWDDRCGKKFKDISEFNLHLDDFIANIHNYSPDQFIKEELTLEIASKKYFEIYEQLRASII